MIELIIFMIISTILRIMITLITVTVNQEKGYGKKLQNNK